MRKKLICKRRDELRKIQDGRKSKQTKEPIQFYLHTEALTHCALKGLRPQCWQLSTACLPTAAQGSHLHYLKKKFKRTCTHVRKCLRGNENYNKHTHTQNNNKITNVLGPIRFCLRPSLQSLTQDKLRRSIWLLPS